MFGGNRGGRGAFPFQNLNNAQFAAEVPANANVANQQNVANLIQERLVNVNEPLHASAFSIYQQIWSYTVGAGADHLNALQNVWNRMALHVTNDSIARVRIATRDRERVVARIDDDGGLIRSYLRRLNGPIEFANNFQSFFDTFLHLLESNEELEIEDFVFLLDLSSNLQGGGTNDGDDDDGADDDRSENTILYHPGQISLKADRPPQYKNSTGLSIVPKRMKNLCGWCAIVLHIATRFTPAESYELLKLPECFWQAVRREIIVDPQNRFTNAKRASYLNRTPNALVSTAGLLKILCGGGDLLTIPRDIEKLCKRFPCMRFVVMTGMGAVCHESQGAEFVLSAETADQFCCYLLLDTQASHYHYVYDPRLFLNKCTNYRWCHGCFQVLSLAKYDRHSCKVLVCNICRGTFTDRDDFASHRKVARNIDESLLQCDRCLKQCPNEICFVHHIKTCTSRDKKNSCEGCGALVQNLDNHRCPTDPNRKCTRCSEEYTRDTFHRCMIQQLKAPDTYDVAKEMLNYYAFDFESAFIRGPDCVCRMADGSTVSRPVEIHHVNFVAVRQLGTGVEWTFDTLGEFVSWTATLQKNSTLYAHNMKGYDGRLLFDQYVNVEGVAPETVFWNGTKLMFMKVGRLTYRDSVLHVQSALADFPKIFGLDERQFAKGFFPYTFNRPENQEYVGVIPPIKFFEPDMMGAKKRKEFLVWYAQQQSVVYNFRDELKRYCISDVQILAKSLEVYMRDGMEMNSGLNPLKCNTVASYAMNVYRTLHLPAYTVAVLSKEEEKFAKRAMHGGRTDVRRMCKFYTQDQVAQGEYAKYQDVQSLYPTVQFYKDLPVGIPVIHRYISPADEMLQPQPSEEDVLNEWFGLVECDIEPVEYLHHPVVVAMNNETGKLQADLYAKKRIVLTTPELQTAMRNGYLVTKVYEYHQYQRSADLFKSYIRQYLRTKIHCGGMPSHITNDSEWQEYRDYHERELGIKLVREEMVKNAGKKQLAKMMLNSLWGKFAETKNQCVHTVCTKVSDFRGLEDRWDSGEIDITLRMQTLKQDLIVVYRFSDPEYHDEKRSLRTNVALASFVTAWGALILWEQMNELGDRVIYHDTDSIVYEHVPDMFNISEGKYLGEWEDETAGMPIVSFVSTGPKTYAFAYLEPPEPLTDEKAYECLEKGQDFWVGNDDESMRRLQYKCKSKGFSLNAYNMSQVNFQQLHRLLIGDKDALKTKSLKFQWNRLKGQMTTHYEEKSLKLTYDKGIIDRSDFTVYPFGYERFATSLTELRNSRPRFQ